MHANPNTHCEQCGANAPTKNVFFIRHVGLIVMFWHRHVRGRMCRRCIDSAFLTTTGITAVLGWWGIISFFVTCVALPVNIINYLGALSLPKGSDDPFAPQPQAAYETPQPGAQATPYRSAAGAPPKSRKAGLIIAAVMGIPILLCCLGTCAFFGWAGGQSTAVRNVGRACLGEPSSEAAAYDPDEMFPHVLAIDVDGSFVQVNYDVLPAPYETRMADEVQLVLCLDEEVETRVESCPYMTPSGEGFVERYRYSQRARIVVARTGVELADEHLRGSEAMPCPETADFYPGAPIRQTGGHVGADEAVAMIQRLTEPAPPAVVEPVIEPVVEPVVEEPPSDEPAPNDSEAPPEEPPADPRY